MDPIRTLHLAPATERKAERGRFDTALRGAATGAGHAVAQSLSLAAPFLPGGPILAGALHGAAAPPAGAGGKATLSSSGETGGGDVVEATRALQAEAQTFNLQYLQLQESLQRESREFTAVSNVMKVRHETAKSAIQNIH